MLVCRLLDGRVQVHVTTISVLTATHQLEGADDAIMVCGIAGKNCL